MSDAAAGEWRENRESGWFRDIGYTLQTVLGAHRYVIEDKGAKPGDPGWHACSCGEWEGYWSSFHPHVADHLRAALPPVAGPEVRPDETLRALSDAATGGPWKVILDGEAVDSSVGWIAKCSQPADSALIAAAVNAVRAALASPAPAPGDEGLRARVASALRSYMGDCEGLIERDVPFYADDADDLAAAVVAALASPAPAATEVGEGER